MGRIVEDETLRGSAQRSNTEASQRMAYCGGIDWDGTSIRGRVGRLPRMELERLEVLG
jgi:hypothetical protein